MAAAKTGYTYISASIQDSKEIPEANSMFSGNSMALSGRLYLETGSQKCKMAAAKQDVPISQLLCQTAKKFPRISAYFWGCRTQLRHMLYLETGKEKFKMPAAKAEVPVSQLQYKIARKFILFSGSGNSMMLDVEAKVTALLSIKCVILLSKLHAW
jgi:hypothetical protein